jgi:hypothetical protein
VFVGEVVATLGEPQKVEYLDTNCSVYISSPTRPSSVTFEADGLQLILRATGQTAPFDLNVSCQCDNLVAKRRIGANELVPIPDLEICKFETRRYSCTEEGIVTTLYKLCPMPSPT